MANNRKESRVLGTERDTELLAAEIVKRVQWGTTLGLSGPLGAGKTFFVRALVEELGGNRAEVASPSYTLQHEYRVEMDKTVEHWDLYRISELPEELLEPPEDSVLRVIEWYEKFSLLTSSTDAAIQFSIHDDGSRSVEVSVSYTDEK